MGINPNNKITIIIRMLFVVTLFQHVWILVETKRMDSLRDKAMCQVQETHGVGVF
jgi:hypothetical protein